MDLEKYINEYPTKYKEGFTDNEIKEMIKKFPGMDMKKFWSPLDYITCMKIDDEILTYHCDVLTAVRCGTEKRDMKWHEFD